MNIHLKLRSKLSHILWPSFLRYDLNLAFFHFPKDKACKLPMYFSLIETHFMKKNYLQPIKIGNIVNNEFFQPFLSILNKVVKDHAALNTCFSPHNTERGTRYLNSLPYWIEQKLLHTVIAILVLVFVGCLKVCICI